MLPWIGAAENQTGTDWVTICRNKYAISDEELSLPCAAIVGAQIDRTSSVYGWILNGKDYRYLSHLFPDKPESELRMVALATPM